MSPGVRRRKIVGPEALVRALGEPTGHPITLHLPPGCLPDGRDLPAGLLSSIAASDVGCFVFSSDHLTHVVVPPFPVEAETTLEGWSVDAIRDLLDRPRTICVFLLRLSGFAVGIFEKDRLVSSKVGSRFVKGRHGKGGSSQARFARRREEQGRALYRKACEVLRAQVDSYEPGLDHLVFGGDRRTLAAFTKECAYVADLEPIRMQRILDVGDPKLATLEGLPRRLYGCDVLTATREEGDTTWRQG